MSKRDIQAVRDGIVKGDSVIIKQRFHAPRPGAPIESMREVKAVVKELMGHVAAVTICNDRWEPSSKVDHVSIIRLQKVVHDEERKPAPMPPRPVKLAATAPVSPPPPPAALANDATQNVVAMDNITAWLEMGRSLRGELSTRIASLQEEAKSCRQEAADILVTAKRCAEELQQEAKALDVEADALKGKLAAIDAVTGGAV